MNKKFTRVMLLIPTIILSAKAYAYDFMVDSMYFNIVSIEEMTCAITYGDSYSNTYAGELIIPEKVTYNGRTLTVTEIDRIGGDSLTSVSIPNTVTTIGLYAFGDCSGLTSINIPNSVTTIESDAFSGCSGLTSINIPNSVTTIAQGALRGCTTYLKELTIGNGIKELPYYENWTLFTHYSGEGEGTVGSLSTLRIADSKDPLTIPKTSLTLTKHGTSGPYTITINDYFYHIPLKDVYIGRNLDYSAYPCFSMPLDKIEFGGYCTQIGSSYCQSVDTLIIGSNIESVNANMIEEQDSLSTIYIKSTTPPQLINNFDSKVYLNTKLYVPVGTKSIYQNAEGWKGFWNIEESSELNDETGISDVQTPRPEVVITSDGITIKESDEAAVSVYSIDGKLLHTATGYQGEKIPLRSGIYIIKVNGNSCKVKI